VSLQMGQGAGMSSIQYRSVSIGVHPVRMWEPGPSAHIAKVHRHSNPRWRPFSGVKAKLSIHYGQMKLATVLSVFFVAGLGAAAQTPCTVPHPAVKYTGPLKRGALIEHPTPVYPAQAKSRGISGSLLFRAHILEDGTIGHLTVLSGPPELQEATEKVLYHWRYTPWTANGQPVDVYTDIIFSFGLPQPNGTVGSPPKPTGQPIPALAFQGLLVRSYPAKRPKEAEKTNIFGTVTLRVVLDETGRIVDLGVLCGPEELEDTALETVRHWIYQPYLSSGHPAAVESTIDVQF
jgi:TonB family protein